MKIDRGSSRLVFSFPKLGFVAKLPIIRISKAFSIFWFYLRKRPSVLLRHLNVYTVDHYGTIKRALFLGLRANYTERNFSKKRSVEFFLPTYFSMFGLLNIQKYGKQVEMSGSDFWNQMIILTNGTSWDDAHHYAEPSNFCVDDGKILIMDYGSPRACKVAVEYGDVIQKYFDFNYIHTRDWQKLKAETA